jgi:hypothetical protein
MWRLPSHLLRLYQSHISIFPPSRAAFHVTQLLQPHSVPKSAGDASYHRFISPGSYLITVSSTADTTLNIIFSPATTSHNSDLLITFLAHCVALFPTVAPSYGSPRTTGSHWNPRLGVAVLLCTRARGLGKFSCAKPVTDSAWLDLNPVCVFGKFLSYPALISALTCLRIPKSAIRAGLHRFFCPGCGDCPVVFYDYTNHISAYSYRRVPLSMWPNRCSLTLFPTPPAMRRLISSSHLERI